MFHRHQKNIIIIKIKNRNNNNNNNKSHLNLDINTSFDKRRSSYFGPPSPYQKNRALSIHKTKHGIKSSYQHAEEKEGEPVSHLGVLSTEQLRKHMMMMGNTV